MIEAWSEVARFENAVANYAGSPYAVAVDTCTSAIFLCCKYLGVKHIILPSHTYISVPSSIIQSGGTISFNDYKWKGIYQLNPYPIIDSACRFKRNMYIDKTLYCLSFQYRKHLPIGRGGMILTDDEVAANWLRCARFNGKSAVDAEPKFIGWHCFMEPERAARGMVLLSNINDDNPDLIFEYPDVSQYAIFKPNLS